MDVSGGSPGTGRPTSSTSRERADRAFTGELDAARRQEREHDAEQARGRSRRDVETSAEPRTETPGVDERASEPQAPGASRETHSSEPIREESAELEPQSMRGAGADVQPEATIAADEPAPSGTRPVPSAGRESAPAAPGDSLPSAGALLGGALALPGQASATQGRPTPDAGASATISTVALDMASSGPSTTTASPSPGPQTQAAGQDVLPAVAGSAETGDGEEGVRTEPAKVEGPRGQTAEPGRTSAGVATEPFRSRETAAPVEAARAEPARAPVDDQAAQILRQVRLQLTPELRQASIQLEPAALGRLSIRLEVRRGRVRAELVVERSETLATLERHAPELRAALASAGFREAELSLGLARDERGRAGSDTPRGSASPRARANETIALEASVRRTLAREGGIDTYA